ncbi:MAG: hypothetical protein OEV40_27905 [Acidimicrobiia bacterium]|nr:hypothetical protein [Acidimicrobiia bacterium]
MDSMELVRTACPKIADLGSAFYFQPETVAKGKELGLDGFRFYFLGRGGVLGDVEPRVVQAAFGYFEPGLIAKIWTSAKERMAPRDAARAYLGCAHEFGRRTFADIEGLDGFCAAAEAVSDAVNVAGLPLYAGISSEPLADDAPARAMQLTAVLREYRGSVHLLALRSKGLDDRVAHAIKRPDDVATFGWPEPPTITDDDRAKHAAAEELTDELVLGAYGVLDDGGATSLLAGLEAMEAAAAG